MDTQTFYIGTVFVAGILSFFSPCIVPLIPVYFGIFMSRETGTSRSKIFLKTLLFVSGISVTFILLGFGAGALGSLIDTKYFMMAIGIVVIILGLHQTGLINISILGRGKSVELQRSKKHDSLGVFLLGFSFSFGWTPCIGPVLGTILGIAAAGSQTLYGGFLMAVYSLGFLIPFLVLAFFSDILVKKIRPLYRHLDKIKIAGGVLIIIMGIFLTTDNLNWLTSVFG